MILNNLILVISFVMFAGCVQGVEESIKDMSAVEKTSDLLQEGSHGFGYSSLGHYGYYGTPIFGSYGGLGYDYSGYGGYAKYAIPWYGFGNGLPHYAYGYPVYGKYGGYYGNPFHGGYYSGYKSYL